MVLLLMVLLLPLVVLLLTPSLHPHLQAVLEVRPGSVRLLPQHERHKLH